MFEFGYIEPIADVRAKAMRWLAEVPSVNEVVVIQISKEMRAMWAEQYRRGAVNPLVHVRRYSLRRIYL